MAQKGKKKKQLQKQRPTNKANALQGFPSWYSNQKWHKWGLFLLGFLLYANTLTHDYALDDAIVIYNNMFVEDGVSGFPGILTKDTFFGFFKEEGKANLVAGGRYRPMSLLLFALEVQIFGKNPLVGHLMNGLFYGGTIVLLYLVLLQLFRPKQNAARAYFIALTGAVLFTVLPVHTEVVANIKGRDEILALLGSLAALYFAFRAYFEKNNRLGWLGGGLFFLALMSKENAITFLAIVPLAFYFFTKASTSAMVKHTVPLLVGAAAFLAIRFSILGVGGGEPVTEMMNNPFMKVEGGRYVAFTAQEHIATVLFGLGKYLQLLIAPVTLTHDYYPRQVGVMDFGDWQVWLSLLAYLALAAYAVWGFRRKDPLSFAIFYYLITLSIVANILFPVGTHLAERLLFMPSVGFVLALAILGHRLVKRRASAGKLPTYRHYSGLVAVIGILALVFAARTIVRNPAWKDNYTLFTTDIAYSPGSAKLRNAVGGELITQSTNEADMNKRQQMLREAVGHLNEAIRIHPNYKNAHLLLGNAYNYLQEFDQAVAAYQRALAIDPNYRDARRNLGITYKDAGKYYGETMNQLDKAIQYLNKAYEILPEEYEVLRLLGVAHGIKGNGLKAVEYFTLAANQNPQDAQAWMNLATAHSAIGNNELGLQYREKAFQLDPGLRVQGGNINQ
jgi:tetratricopeptide (TPR) repeat protein